MFGIQKPKKIEQFWNHYFHCELSFTKLTSVVMMESSVLRFPYKLLALRLNRSRSRYKSPTEKAELPPRPISQGNVITSDPLYQEITDFPDKSLKEVDCKKSDPCASQNIKKLPITNNTRKPPPLPQPYSGSLFGRINSMEIADDFLTVDSKPIKSSSFSEGRSLELSQVTGRPKAASLHSSPPTLKTLAAIVSDSSRNDQKKINQDHFQTTPLSIKKHNTIDGHEDTVKHDISRCDSTTVSCSEPKVVVTAEMDKQKPGSKDKNKESDVYVVMAATKSVKESISTPLLSEDNMYVAMSPLPPRQQSLRVEDHTYYNFHESNNHASLPNFKTIELLEEDEEHDDTRSSFVITKAFLSQDNYEDSRIYEPVDYSRPIPPPRRKKLLKLQQASPLSSPGSSPILRYHTMSQSKSTTLSPPPSSSTKNPSNYSPFLILRKQRTISTPDGRKGERRRRPEGIVFSDAVADGLLLKNTTTLQESR